MDAGSGGGETAAVALTMPAAANSFRSSTAGTATCTVSASYPRSSAGTVSLCDCMEHRSIPTPSHSPPSTHPHRNSCVSDIASAVDGPNKAASKDVMSEESDEGDVAPAAAAAAAACRSGGGGTSRAPSAQPPTRPGPGSRPSLSPRAVLSVACFCVVYNLPLVVAAFVSDDADVSDGVETYLRVLHSVGEAAWLLFAAVLLRRGGSNGVDPGWSVPAGGVLAASLACLAAPCYDTSSAVYFPVLPFFVLLTGLAHRRRTSPAARAYTAPVHMAYSLAGNLVGFVLPAVDGRREMPTWAAFASNAVVTAFLGLWYYKLIVAPRQRGNADGALALSTSDLNRPVVREKLPTPVVDDVVVFVERPSSQMSGVRHWSSESFHGHGHPDDDGALPDGVLPDESAVRSCWTADSGRLVDSNADNASGGGSSDGAGRGGIPVNPLTAAAAAKVARPVDNVSDSGGDVLPYGNSEAAGNSNDVQATHNTTGSGGGCGVLHKRNTSSKAATSRRVRNPPGKDTKIEWRRGDQIGSGGYGVVHIGLNEVTGQLMAVKSIPFNSKDAAIQTKLLMLANEISVMKKLSHANIVSYYFAERVGDVMNIFMEYVPGGSLRQVLDQFGLLGDAVASAYTEQILIGVAYLHSQQVVHRDIKCANVLLTVDGLCKLADFGSSCYLDNIASKRSDNESCDPQGTPVWMAPEVLIQAQHDWRCDIWSVGCTVMEMLTAKPPFHHYNQPPLKTLDMVLKEPIKFPTAVSLGAGKFLQVCLGKDPRSRPEALDLIAHPWVRMDEDSPKTFGYAPGSPVMEQSDSMSVVSRRSYVTFRSTTSQVSMASARYHDALRGSTAVKGSTERDSDALRNRRVHAVRADLGHRASLLGGPVVKATVTRMASKVLLPTEEPGGEDGEDTEASHALRFVLGEGGVYDSDESEDGTASPDFRKLLAPAPGR